MSQDNAFRELKFSPTQLAIVFLCILILGIFIFLLGTSVGKKQTELRAQAQPGAAEKPQVETVTPPIPIGADITTTVAAEPQRSQAQAADAAGTKAEKPGENAAAPPETKTAEKTEQTIPGTEAKPETKMPSGAAKPEPKAAAVETKREIPSAPAYQGEPYYVQIGAVDNRPGAEALAKKAADLGFPTVVLGPFDIGGKQMFRIRVGPYPTRAEAADIMAKLTVALKGKGFFLAKG